MIANYPKLFAVSGFHIRNFITVKECREKFRGDLIQQFYLC